MQIVFIYKYFWVIGARRRAIHGDVHRCLCARRQRTTCARGFRLPVGELRGLSFRAGCGDRFAHDETVRDEFRAIAVRGAWRAKSKFV